MAGHGSAGFIHNAFLPQAKAASSLFLKREAILSNKMGYMADSFMLKTTNILKTG